MIVNSQRTSEPGPLLGALMPPPAIGARIGDPAKAGDLRATAVVGSLLAEAFIPPIPSPAKLSQSGVFRALREDFSERFPGENLDTLLDPRLIAKAKVDALVELKAFINARLSNMFSPPPAVAGAAYESRVLNGVWAVAWLVAASSIRKTSAMPSTNRRSRLAASQLIRRTLTAMAMEDTNTAPASQTKSVGRSSNI